MALLALSLFSQALATVTIDNLVSPETLIHSPLEVGFSEQQLGIASDRRRLSYGDYGGDYGYGSYGYSYGCSYDYCYSYGYSCYCYCCCSYNYGYD